MRGVTLTAASALLLAGCASFSADGGFGAVEQLTRERTGQTPVSQRTAQDSEAAQGRMEELLSEPLGSSQAVELAFLNNKGLQASFQNLGIAESDLVSAGRLRNPTFSFGRLSGGGDVEIDRAILFDVLGLLTMPLATQVEQRRFEQAKIQAASDAVEIASQTRRAYFSALAAQVLLTYFRQVKDAADASSELARRMAAAGNFSKLAQLREQSFYADATANLARAQHQAVAARESLVRMLGLSSHQLDFKLPERLPDLPKEPAQPVDAERTAMEQRLDIMMAKRSTEAVAQSLGLSKATRFVNVLHAGYANASRTGEARKDGYEIEVVIPLFDFGSSRVARAEAIYLQAVYRAAQTAINARSEVRETYSAYRTAYDLARHYRDEIVPLRKQISEENMLRYNGMLIGVFDLLADSREQVASVVGYVQALRDYWLAQTDLQTAMTGQSPAAPSLSGSTMAAGAESAARH